MVHGRQPWCGMHDGIRGEEGTGTLCIRWVLGLVVHVIEEKAMSHFMMEHAIGLSHKGSARRVGYAAHAQVMSLSKGSVRRRPQPILGLKSGAFFRVRVRFPIRGMKGHPLDVGPIAHDSNLVKIQCGVVILGSIQTSLPFTDEDPRTGLRIIRPLRHTRMIAVTASQKARIQHHSLLEHKPKDAHLDIAATKSIDAVQFGKPLSTCAAVGSDQRRHNGLRDGAIPVGDVQVDVPRTLGMHAVENRNVRRGETIDVVHPRHEGRGPFAMFLGNEETPEP